jgi:hypothetical protein
MLNDKPYTYRVIWSEEDQEYVGLCAEFPSLSYLDRNREAALNGIVSLIKHVITDITANDTSM